MTRTPDILAGLGGQGGDDGLAAALGPQARLMDGAALRMDGGTQPREEISDELVLEYKEAMQAGAQFPPVVAYFDGSAYWLADGFHRVHAADAAGLQVLVDVRQGTRRDAVLFSVGANATHGMRRTNADKRRSVLALLHDDEWRQWSDREIARRCAVSNQFVSNVRAELSVNDGQIEKRRVERNGVEYDMKLPQRSAGPAVAAQGGKYATPDDLHAAVRSWLVAYDTAEEREAALAEVCELEGSVTFDDLAEWIDVKPRRAEDLIQAARVVLTEVRWEMASAEEPGRMAAQPLTPLPVEELEEALLALDGVSLPGVDEDWLFDYMTDFVKRDGYSITRPVFDMAMRLATPRQVAALQRQDRLERARAAAMASDAERARAAVQPELAQPEREEWPKGEPTRSMDVLTDDSRVLLRLTLGYPAKDVWVELVQHQVRWLRDELSASLVRLEAAEARRIEALR